MIRVAINGFGRIGRCLTRLLASTGKDLELVAINSRADIARDIHLFKYDSVHGRFPGTVVTHGENLIINGREVRVTRVLDPEGLPWKELGVDIVLESTGARQLVVQEALEMIRCRAGSKSRWLTP